MAVLSIFYLCSWLELLFVWFQHNFDQTKDFLGNICILSWKLIVKTKIVCYDYDFFEIWISKFLHNGKTTWIILNIFHFKYYSFPSSGPVSEGLEKESPTKNAILPHQINKIIQFWIYNERKVLWFFFFFF